MKKKLRKKRKIEEEIEYVEEENEIGERNWRKSNWRKIEEKFDEEIVEEEIVDEKRNWINKYLKRKDKLNKNWRITILYWRNKYNKRRNWRQIIWKRYWRKIYRRWN